MNPMVKHALRRTAPLYMEDDGENLWIVYYPGRILLYFMMLGVLLYLTACAQPLRPHAYGECREGDGVHRHLTDSTGTRGRALPSQTLF